MQVKTLLFLILPLLIFTSTHAFTKKNNGSALSLYVENDTRSIGGPGSDQHYTNGIKISYIYAENKIPNWSKPLINWSEYLTKQLKESETNYGLSLAHQIYTPNDTQEKNLIVEDRPYAGWLYAGFMVRFNQPMHSHFLELNLGIVGPSALGQQVQNEFHRMIGQETAKGWDNQLKDEPGIQLTYQQRLRFIEYAIAKDRNIVDIIPYFGGSLGNILIGAHIGSIIRVGNKLSDDFGPTRLSSGDGDATVHTDSDMDFSLKSEPRIYGFAGIKGNLIGRDIFLDGNSFQGSHRVAKYGFTYETELGFGFEWSRLAFVWRFVGRSPQFKERNRFTSFASVSLNYYL